MTSPDAAIAARPEACSACGAPLDSLGHCAKCGAVFGEAYRCPLCQALSDIEPDATLYFRCRSCGGPRIPPNGKPVSEPETKRLREARSEQRRAAAFRAGSGFALASGVLSIVVTSVVLLASTPAPFAEVAAIVASLIPFALCLFALRRAQSHARRFDAALEQAWLLAASRVVATDSGQLSAAGLAKALRVDEARAEFLLAEVSVQELIEQPAPVARLRVTERADGAEPSAVAEPADALARASKP